MPTGDTGSGAWSERRRERPCTPFQHIEYVDDGQTRVLLSVGLNARCYAAERLFLLIAGTISMLSPSDRNSIVIAG